MATRGGAGGDAVTNSDTANAIGDDDIVIRDGAFGDVGALVDSNVAMAMESEGLVLDPETVRRGLLAVMGDSGRGRYLMAVCGDVIAGHLMLTTEWSDWRCGWWWWIQSVFVAPSFRRRGVYRRLHDHVMTEIDARSDVCGVRLYVDVDNVSAIKTYEALGMGGNYRVMELPRRP